MILCQISSDLIHYSVEASEGRCESLADVRYIKSDSGGRGYTLDSPDVWRFLRTTINSDGGNCIPQMILCRNERYMTESSSSLSDPHPLSQAPLLVNLWAFYSKLILISSR